MRSLLAAELTFKIVMYCTRNDISLELWHTAQGRGNNRCDDVGHAASMIYLSVGPAIRIAISSPPTNEIDRFYRVNVKRRRGRRG